MMVYYLCASIKVKVDVGIVWMMPENGRAMEVIHGLRYNLQGLRMGLTSGRLLFWGMVRFVLVVMITVVLAAIILIYQIEITELLWQKPISLWIVWIWHVLSWLISLLLIAFSAILSFLICQIFFSAVIMDHMSKITELRATGGVVEGKKFTLFGTLFHLMKQEIPRTFVPLLLSSLILVLGWITPFAPLAAIASGLVSALFLSWDNTDLVPARRSMTFKNRFKLMLSTIPFHIGFGLPFLIPGVNLLFLSFAPVGATLYYIERYGRSKNREEKKKIEEI
jgi:CysZ protein